MSASHIGQYRILRKIGSGGMGLIFLAEHTLLGRRAAIKTLLPTVSANHENVERFFNEARATSAISDPGVIQIFDFGFHVDGTAYIVMEFLDGESLFARIDRLGKMSLADTLRIARQLTGSLAAAHAQGIVHRDLKPENIFLVCDAEAQGGERTKILDFGICKVGTNDMAVTQSGAMIGTPIYMAPEQCRGAANVDHRADIYASGCLMFEMLTGRPPFTGNSTDEVLLAHLESEPPAPSRYVAALPPAIDALLLRCLAKSPGDRYQSMTELQQVLGDLYAALEGSEPAGAAVSPALGLGSRPGVMNGGNVAALGSGSSRSARVMPHLQPTLTPGTMRMSDPYQRDVSPGRRTHMPTLGVLVCGLVGMVIGLLTTSLIVSSRANPAPSSPPAPGSATVERAERAERVTTQVTTPVAATVENEVPSAGPGPAPIAPPPDPPPIPPPDPLLDLPPGSSHSRVETRRDIQPTGGPTVGPTSGPPVGRPRPRSTTPSIRPPAPANEDLYDAR